MLWDARKDRSPKEGTLWLYYNCVVYVHSSKGRLEAAPPPIPRGYPVPRRQVNGIFSYGRVIDYNLGCDRLAKFRDHRVTKCRVDVRMFKGGR